MAVYTEVGRRRGRRAPAATLGLGALTDLRGIRSGIENTNYYATTAQGQWVITLFERLTPEQLPYYLGLMRHLARKGLPVPEPRADAAGSFLHALAGKPAALVNKLPGRPPHRPPDAPHCAQVGAMLARMHLAGRDYPRQQPNLRGLAWWNETVPVVLPHVGAAHGRAARRRARVPARLPVGPPRAPAAWGRSMPTCSATT